jgi:outer membrane protein assembly factor BamA
LGLCLSLFALAPASRAADAKTNKPARVKVSGFGFLGNREMARLLRNFQTNREQPSVIDRTFVEDAALVLLSRLNQDGYLNPTLRARFTLLNGSRQRFTWTNALEAQLPLDFAAREARFRVRRGVRFHYDSLEIVGAKAIPPRAARRYFVSGDALLKLRADRTFSPARLEASRGALKEALARKGFREAEVTATELKRDPKSGKVAVRIRVEEGPRSIVRAVTVEMEASGDIPARPPVTLPVNEPYSPLWQQDFAYRLREEQYAKGFPDAAVQFSTQRRETNTANIEVDLRARVSRGPLVRLGRTRFEGHRRTRPSVLEGRVKLEEGGPLDRLEAEKARQRLARLGVFDRVSLRYDKVDDTTRDAVYELEEGKATSLSVLGGYGSYEKLRGGLEFEHRNVLGLAHAVRLRGIQSFKATSGDGLYTVPEIFLENMNLFARGSGLRREEASFTREEYGGSVGVQKRLAPIQTDLSVRYNYEFLNALDLDTADTNRLGVTEARAAAFVIELTRDRRDNPLWPRRGLKLFSNLELASAGLGGNMDYQRLVLGGSYHRDVGGGRLLHFGVTHGISFTLGGRNPELPVNKRFLPGGENSVRGYQEGEASPLDDNGDQLGAETFTQANVEFEQLLTRSWSVVAFFDAVGFARERGDYPWDEGLYSAGGGVRWRTVIGPVRLEYGHNLNRRRHDPAGTLHLSVGFPF